MRMFTLFLDVTQPELKLNRIQYRGRVKDPSASTGLSAMIIMIANQK